MLRTFDDAALQLSKACAVLACAINYYDQDEEDENVSLLVETANDLLVEADEFFRHCVVSCSKCPKGSEI